MIDEYDDGANGGVGIGILVALVIVILIALFGGALTGAI